MTVVGASPCQTTQKILPTTLQQWEEAGEMAKKSKIGMKFYPSANIRQEVLVSLKNAFGEIMP